jgi:hypothetical protein
MSAISQIIFRSGELSLDIKMLPNGSRKLITESFAPINKVDIIEMKLSQGIKYDKEPEVLLCPTLFYYLRK